MQFSIMYIFYELLEDLYFSISVSLNIYMYMKYTYFTSYFPTWRPYIYPNEDAIVQAANVSESLWLIFTAFSTFSLARFMQQLSGKKALTLEALSVTLALISGSWCDSDVRAIKAPQQASQKVSFGVKIEIYTMKQSWWLGGFLPKPEDNSKRDLARW